MKWERGTGMLRKITGGGLKLPRGRDSKLFWEMNVNWFKKGEKKAFKQRTQDFCPEAAVLTRMWFLVAKQKEKSIQMLSPCFPLLLLILCLFSYPLWLLSPPQHFMTLDSNDLLFLTVPWLGWAVLGSSCAAFLAGSNHLTQWLASESSRAFHSPSASWYCLWVRHFGFPPGSYSPISRLTLV